MAFDLGSDLVALEILLNVESTRSVLAIAMHIHITITAINMYMHIIL